jgi:hypothetical protein
MFLILKWVVYAKSMSHTHRIILETPRWKESLKREGKERSDLLRQNNLGDTVPASALYNVEIHTVCGI